MASLPMPTSTGPLRNRSSSGDSSSLHSLGSDTSWSAIAGFWRSNHHQESSTVTTTNRHHDKKEGLSKAMSSAMASVVQLEHFLERSNSLRSLASEDDDDGMKHELRQLCESEEAVRHDLDLLQHDPSVTPHKLMNSNNNNSNNEYEDESSPPELVWDSPMSVLMSPEPNNNSNTGRNSSSPALDDNESETYCHFPQQPLLQQQQQQQQRLNTSAFGLKRQISEWEYRKLQTSLQTNFVSAASANEKDHEMENHSNNNNDFNRDVTPLRTNTTTNIRKSYYPSRTNHNNSTRPNMSNKVNHMQQQQRDLSSSTEYGLTSQVPASTQYPQELIESFKGNEAEMGIISWVASLLFGTHVYEVRPILYWIKTDGTSQDNTVARTYQGTLCVWLACVMAMVRTLTWMDANTNPNATMNPSSTLDLDQQQYHDTVMLIVWKMGMTLLLPTLLTWTEVHLPHKMDDVGIALLIVILAPSILLAMDQTTPDQMDFRLG
eukprot:CAMPEP_0198287080 /NCGR_PEP_ID=MMETSP1449-20131203/6007_1 /TAXON_ID=420275 /ORGANISM="Attheya septentrionalis, Strain CCMP2084" /LENGTH=490 /DNA_ID=CAMNT_0043984977 /DNA_START=87 /DNA_END=1559 /DNA_ORIENTATION=+